VSAAPRRTANAAAASIGILVMRGWRVAVADLIHAPSSISLHRDVTALRQDDHVEDTDRDRRGPGDRGRFIEREVAFDGGDGTSGQDVALFEVWPFDGFVPGRLDGVGRLQA
jgi:hypothetical protein